MTINKHKRQTGPPIQNSRRVGLPLSAPLRVESFKVVLSPGKGMSTLLLQIAAGLLYLCVCGLFLSGAIKTEYGGEVNIRLNEPDSYAFSPSDYSNLVFCSLLYENLFYLKENGAIESNIFESFKYDKQSKTLILQLKDNLSYSDGNAVTTRDINNSLRLFLDKNLASSRKIRSAIKNIKTVENNRVHIELLYDNPGITGMLTAPELALLPHTNGVYSGIFYPAQKVGGEYLILRPNKFYPGGRAYIDAVKVRFSDSPNLDVFLSKPGSANLHAMGFQEFNAGVFQNIYILFPGEKLGQNTRIALYSLLKNYFRQQDSGLEELNAMTSNEESPISLNIKKFSTSRTRSILRYMKIKLYIPNSMRDMEDAFKEFLRRQRVPMETIYLSDNELANFMNHTSIKYLLLGKVFNKRMPLEDKIKRIVREMSFSRFNEKYLNLINELDEVKYLKNEELLLNQVSKIVEEIIRDGFVLPLYQERYSIYIKKKVHGIEIDHYGRPLFQGVRVK